MKTNFYTKHLFLALAACQTLAASLKAEILAGPITNSENAHLYFLLTASTWGEAEAEAVSIGGHLTTIRNNREDDFVHRYFSAFGGADRILWIGLTDKGVEGTFRWISGEETTYRNWAGTEPNNSNGGENRAGMWPSGKWNDFTGGATGNGVVEVIPGLAASISLHRAVEIAWPTQTTNTYQIQWSSALAPTNWFYLAGPIQGTGTTNYYFSSTRGDDQKFYRVMTLQP